MIQAKHYTRGGNKPRLIVLHSTEGHERPGEAPAVAAWFANKAAPRFPAPRASAHYVVDATETVQCVAHGDQAWHAGAVNGFSIGIEIVGRADQTPDQWADPYSKAALSRVADLLVSLSRALCIPLVSVGPEGILAGLSGVTTHGDCTKAFKVPRGHTDPGPGFPLAGLLEMAQARLQGPRFEIAEDVLFPSAGPWMPTPRPGVVVECQGQRWAVSPAQLGHVAIGEADTLARAAGFELPTPALVDAIWRAADLKISPNPQIFPNWTQPEMDAPEAHAKQHAHVLKMTENAGSYILQAGGFKDVVQTPEGLGLYGWHARTGRPIQDLYLKHVLGWSDYSQGVRFVSRLP